MSKTLVFGDVHFSDNRSYHYQAGEAFLKFYKDLKENNPDNIAIFLGDLCENKVINGKVIEQLNKLFRYSRFKKVYVLVGNHDVLHKANVGTCLVYEFARDLPNVVILEKPAEVLNIGKLKVLSLPHFNFIPNTPPMYDYYNNLPKDTLSQSYDLCIGHFTDSTTVTFHGSKTVDLSPVNAKRVLLGHIHQPGGYYVGSIYALNPLQNDLKKQRKIHVYDDGTQSWEHITLPNFVQFNEITFKDRLPKTDALIDVWTIFNCNDPSLIEDVYGDIIVRQLNSRPKTLNPALQKRKDFKAAFMKSSAVTNLELLNELISMNGTNYYNRTSIKLLRSLFTNEIKSEEKESGKVC